LELAEVQIMTIMIQMTYPTDNGVQWTVAEAKAKFSELVERARSGGPQTITRHGRPAAVLVSAEEWAKKAKRHGTLAEFLTASPLRGVNLNLPRKRDLPRQIEL